MSGLFIAIIIVSIIIIALLIIMAVGAVRRISQWMKNNKAPRTPVQARVVTKRAYTRGGARACAATLYYITFEFLSGDRAEFHVPDREYGLIAENDDGVLTFQGTRFISFERSNN